MSMHLIHEAFFAQAEKTPEHVAVSFEGQTLTYRELDEQSNRLAHFLREAGVKPNSLVGLMAERSLQLPVSLLGILKAGAAYVPLDPNYPTLRLQGIIEKADLHILLTENHLESKLAEVTEGLPSLQTVVQVDADPRLAQAPATRVENCNQPLDLMCVLFTSGSTGKPKGVMIHHKAVMNCLTSAITEFALCEDDRVAAVSSMSFDMSVFEFFAPLISGGRLCMLSSATVRDPWKMLAVLEEQQITIWHSVPTIWGMWLNLVKPERVPALSLRYVYLGGERLPVEYVRRSMRLFPQTTVVNIYGPTETTVWMTAQRVLEFPPDDCDSLPVGQPIQGVDVLILDEERGQCPNGTVGEIYIGGVCLSKGYLKDEERNKESFFRNPYSEQEEYLYKTGDLGLFREDGNLEIVGRVDFQVKIRGNRVELGEIESVALEVEGVHQAAVVMDKLSETLHCFVTTTNSELAAEDLRNYLSSKLTPYMVPHQFQIVDQMPTNANGKIDRKELEQQVGAKAEEPVEPAAKGIGEAARQVIGTVLSNAYNEILGYEDWAANESFFQIGGDSIKIVQLKMILDEHFPEAVELADLFAYTTYDELLDYLIEKAPSLEGLHLESGLASVEAEGQDALENISDRDIAIIGIGGRFPTANNPDAFWEMLERKNDGVREVPKERWDPAVYYDPNPLAKNKTNSKWGGFIDGIDQFDAQYFAISPKEAQLLDPQQRLALEVAWETLENAGYSTESVSGTATGVFFTASNDDYGNELMRRSLFNETYSVIGTQLSMVPNRISYMLNLSGPSLFVDTACSSSLVAIHLACQSIANGESEMALAGGVTLQISPLRYTALSKMMILSPTGHCHAFDQKADGFVPGEGAGMVLLKPLKKALADGDHIQAVIKGSAINHGGLSMGITAPNPRAQEAVIRMAYENSGVPTDSISYVEAHGTGTPLGDPIEIKALTQVFGKATAGEKTIRLGSVKASVGHLAETAGVASVIKVVQALKHKKIPGQLHVETLNPDLHLDTTKFYINTDTEEWHPAAGVRRAGISSFGMGGTNVHLILEESPQAPVRTASEAGTYLVTLSARTDTALLKKAADLQAHLETRDGFSLRDLSFTLNTGRTQHAHRLALVAESVAELKNKLADLARATDSFARGEGLQTAAVVSYGVVQSKRPQKLEPDLSFPVSSAQTSRLQEIIAQYVGGATVSFAAMYQGLTCRRIELPTYPFERQRYWMEEGDVPNATQGAEEAARRAVEAALAETAAAAPTTEETATRSVDAVELERKLMGMVAELLVDQSLVFDEETDFFDLNIDSLAAVELISAIENETNLRLPNNVVFDHPSVRELASYLLAELSEANDVVPTTDALQQEWESKLLVAIQGLVPVEPSTVDVESDFFDLDLDSLDAVELVNFTQEMFGVHVTAKEIFEYPTVRELVARLMEARE